VVEPEKLSTSGGYAEMSADVKATDELKILLSAGKFVVGSHTPTKGRLRQWDSSAALKLSKIGWYKYQELVPESKNAVALDGNVPGRRASSPSAAPMIETL
jgi:hypothetical protein